MWFMSCIVYFGTFLQISFLTLGLAAGLYYLAELVEEFTSTARKIMHLLVVTAAVANVGLLLFEDFPWYVGAVGLVAQAAHWSLLRHFPAFNYASVSFVASIVCVVAGHFIAFRYFAEHFHETNQVISYFVVYQWLVPFGLLVSSSANDQTLPSQIGRANLGTALDDGTFAPFNPSEDDAQTAGLFSPSASVAGGWRRRPKSRLLTFLRSLQESLIPSVNKRHA